MRTATSPQANFLRPSVLHAFVGRTFTTADDRPGCPGTAVLSYDFWQREYEGRLDAVGKTILLDNQPFQILGVIGPGFTRTDVDTHRDLSIYLSIYLYIYIYIYIYIGLHR